MSARAAHIAVTTMILLTGISVGTLLFRHVLHRGQHDFLPFYMGAELATSGQIAQLYDKNAYQPLIAELRNEGVRMSPFDAHYFIRPAFQAFFYVPFTWFRYSEAATLALVANFGLLGVLVWKLPIWFGAAPSHHLALRSALSVFYPFLWSIAVGQDTILLTLLIAYALFLESKGGNAVAGVFIGLCSWKPHLIWLMPLALVAGRKFRMAAYCLATSSVLLCLSLIVVGARGFHQWLELVRGPSSDIYPFDMGNIRAVDIHFGPVIAVTALALVILCFCAVLWRGDPHEKIASAVFAALLLSPHTYWQDYSLVAIVAMLTPYSIIRVMLLLPWPFFYNRTDELPMVFISLACLGYIGVRQFSSHLRGPNGNAIPVGIEDLNQTSPMRVQTANREKVNARGN